jgi:hypothetical protein
VKLKGKYGFINKTGKMLVQPKYDLVSGFFRGFCYIRSDGKWGCINNMGEEIIPAVYDTVDVTGDSITAKLGDEIFYFDKTGKIKQ